jgi:integrase
MTLGELVEEYLEMHQADPVTIAKLRWLRGKATAALGDVRLADLSPKEVYAWRLTIPEGHRFEATQALRQVLNRAIAWELIDYNPAKRGVPNPLRRYKEKRPFDSWQQIEDVAEQLGPVCGPMIVFAAATGLRPSELFALEQRDIDRALGVVYVRRAYANGRIKHTKTRLSNRAVPLQAIALKALDRLPASENPIRFPNSRGGYVDFRSFGRRHWKPAQTAAGIEPLRPSLRPAPHLCHLRATCRGLGVRGVPLHGFEHRDDRLPLRPPRARQPRACRLFARRARDRKSRGRWVDVASEGRKLAQQQGFETPPNAPPQVDGRSVDAEAENRRQAANRGVEQQELREAL